MKKIWQSILNFFGFGAEDQTSDENAKELMAWITSKQRMDLCTQQAFQAVQQREPLPPNSRPHPYEATIKADCIKVDSALTDSHASAISEITENDDVHSNDSRFFIKHNGSIMKVADMHITSSLLTVTS